MPPIFTPFAGPVQTDELAHHRADDDGFALQAGA